MCVHSLAVYGPKVLEIAVTEGHTDRGQNIVSVMPLSIVQYSIVSHMQASAGSLAEPCLANYGVLD